jgi:pantoate--beta-alanine ligase
MEIIKRSADLAYGCAFIPTMGALHAGHGSLFELARTKSDYVVASVFVNPLQFENKEDLAKYPQTPDADIALAEKFGVTHLWLPSYEEIYPENYQRQTAGKLGEIYEGASRSGHFDGVVTVVARLFELVKPNLAIFGEKDFQQLTLIKDLVMKLNLDIEIIAAPIIREDDGLAMSSRNVRLDQTSRKQALVLYRALSAAAESRDLPMARTALLTHAQNQPGFKLDYAEIIDEADFSLANESTQNKRAIIAGWLNGVRLIDNMKMEQGGQR